MNFMVSREGKQYGPYRLESLSGMLGKAEVVPTDLILVEGKSDWEKVADYLKTGSQPSRPVTPPPLPPGHQTGPASTGVVSPAIPPFIESTSELEQSVLQGGRFVVFQYCFSILIMTFKRGSSVIFLRGEEDGFSHAFTNSLISLTVGWWGIPWGPIWTIATVIKNAQGGVDVTQEVLTQKLGPARATQIMARRLRPAPRGNAMKCFRWGLIGAPVLLFLLLLALPLAFTSIDSTGVPRSARGEGREFEAANRRINTYHDVVGQGNSPKAIAAATSFADSMKKMRDVLFEGGKKDGLSVTHHQFLTYCELHDSQCAFIVHAPELRRFSTEAKESLGKMAWVNARAALQQQGITNAGMRLAVGLRGIALYDRVLLGNLGSITDAPNSVLTETVTGSACEKRLHPFFQNAGGNVPSATTSQATTNSP